MMRIARVSMDECAAPGGRCAFFGHNRVGGANLGTRGRGLRGGGQQPAVAAVAARRLRPVAAAAAGTDDEDGERRELQAS